MLLQPKTTRRLEVLLAGLLLAGLVLPAFPAAAQSCNYCPGAPIPVGMCSTSTIVQTGNGCGFVNNCQQAVVSGPTIQIIPQGGGVFTAHLVMNVTAPWNFWATTNDPNGTLSMLWFDVSPAPPPFTSGGDPSLCQYTASDVVNTWVEKTGLTCAGAPYNFGTYSLRSMTCGGPCPPPCSSSWRSSSASRSTRSAPTRTRGSCTISSRRAQTPCSTRTT